MPNHIMNELAFRDVSQEQIAQIIDATMKDGKVDFSILVPVPLNVWQGSTNSEQEKAFPLNWYQWNRENWGTKWNAYDTTEPEIGSDSVTIRFETAWSPPRPWLAALFNKTGLPFQHNWLDEGAERGRTATFSIHEHFGKTWQEVAATDEMHRHLHVLHWGVEEFSDDA